MKLVIAEKPSVGAIKHIINNFFIILILDFKNPFKSNEEKWKNIIINNINVPHRIANINVLKVSSFIACPFLTYC